MSVTFGTDWPTLTIEANFSGSTWTDISAYVRSINTNRPTSNETGKFAAGTATIVLDNRDGRFSPANTAGPYVSGGVSQIVPDVPVRIVAAYNTQTHQLFYGNADDWQDGFPSLGYDATTTLTLVDPLSTIGEWSGSPVALVGENETSDARVDRILTAAGWTGPSVTGAGSSRFAATDLSGNGLAQIQSVVDSEGGFFWFEPDYEGGTTNMLGMFFLGRAGPLAGRSATTWVTFSDTGATTVPFRDLTTSSGRSLVVRTAAFTRNGGVEQVAGSGLPRVVRGGLLQNTDPDVAAVAQLAVDRGNPADAYRIKSLTFDPITRPVHGFGTAIARRMMDRVRVQVTIPASSLVLDQLLLIDGISHSISPMQWSTTYTFASYAAYSNESVSAWGIDVWDTGEWFY